MPHFLEEMPFYLTRLRTKNQEIIPATSDDLLGCLHIFTAQVKLDEWGLFFPLKCHLLFETLF